MIIKQKKSSRLHKETKDASLRSDKAQAPAETGRPAVSNNDSAAGRADPARPESPGSDTRSDTRAETELLGKIRGSGRRRAAVTTVTAVIAALVLLTWAATSGPLNDLFGGPGGGKGAGGKAGNGGTEAGAADGGRVTIAITCRALSDKPEALKDKALKKYIPKDGWILKKTTRRFRKDQTVYDALAGVCREKRIQFETTNGSAKTAYVKGIGYLYEFSAGRRSGWLFMVNKKKPDYGAGSVKLRDGDDIVWYYTIDYTTDTAKAAG